MAEVAMKTAEGRSKRVKKLRSISINHAENGGHIAEHSFDNSGPGDYIQPEQHVFGKAEGKKLLSHVAAHLGIKAANDHDEDDK